MAKLRNVEANKKRVENLYKAGAVSQQNLDEITTGYEMLTEQLRAVDINIGDMTITAPADGIVNVKVLEVNQMMAPGMPVIVETDPEGTWARFNIPETYIDQLNLGDSLTLNSNIGDLNFKAKITQILPMADFATHTPTTLRDQHDVRTFDVKMRILDHQLKCKPGMTVYLSLKPVENKYYFTKLENDESFKNSVTNFNEDLTDLTGIDFIFQSDGRYVLQKYSPANQDCHC